MKIAIEEMITEVENLDNFDSIVIDPDNWRGQYKSAIFITWNSSHANLKNQSLKCMELKVMMKVRCALLLMNKSFVSFIFENDLKD